MNRRQMLGASVAVATATILLGRSGFADDKTAAKKPHAAKKTVKCMGGNECAGKGECGAADGSHGCAGKNECKGKGWVMVSSGDACTKAGGTVDKGEKKS